MGRKQMSSLCHRDKERIRHQMLNKALEHLSGIIPGKKQKETKAFKLKRIMSYMKFLLRKRNEMARLLSRGKINILGSILNECKQETLRSKKTKVSSPKSRRAEIVFLNQRNQLPPFGFIRDLTSKISPPSGGYDSKDDMSSICQESLDMRTIEDRMFIEDASDKSSASNSKKFSSGETLSNNEEILPTNGGKTNSTDFESFANFEIPLIDLPSNKEKYNLQGDVQYSSSLKIQHRNIKKHNHTVSDCFKMDRTISVRWDSDNEFCENNSRSDCHHVDTYDHKASKSKNNFINLIEVPTNFPEEMRNENDQIVPSFANDLPNSQEKENEIQSNRNYVHKGDVLKVDSNVKFEDKKSCDNFDSRLPALNSFTNELFTHDTSELKDKFLTSSSEDAPVFTELSNMKYFSSVKNVEHKDYDIKSEHDYYSHALGDYSNSELFYKNYIFPTTGHFFPNCSLPPLNQWLSHVGNVIPHLYGENMHYQSTSHFNYPHVSDIDHDFQAYEVAEVNDENIGISHGLMSIDANTTDTLQEIRSDFPYNASYCDAQNNSGDDVIIAVEESFIMCNEGENNYNIVSASPHIIADKECSPLDKHEELVHPEIEKPSFNEDTDFGRLFPSSWKAGKRRKQQRPGFRSRHKTAEMQNVQVKEANQKRCNAASVDCSEQVVPGEISHSNSPVVRTERKKSSSSQQENQLATDAKNSSGDFSNFDKMENSYMSLEKYAIQTEFVPNSSAEFLLKAEPIDISKRGAFRNNAVSSYNSSYVATPMFKPLPVTANSGVHFPCCKTLVVKQEIV